MCRRLGAQSDVAGVPRNWGRFVLTAASGRSHELTALWGAVLHAYEAELLA